MRNRFRIIILGGLTLGACIAQAGGREDLAAFAARFDWLGLPDVHRAEYVHALGCWAGAYTHVTMPPDYSV